MREIGDGAGLHLESSFGDLAMTTLRFASLALLCAAALPAQTRVDHTLLQTPIKNQGSRRTCIAFAATAALEARLKRASYGDLNLSEEFVNYVGKMMWLHPFWSDIATADESEAQLAATGGGGGVGHAHNMVHWMKVPAETAMPYRVTDYTLPFVWSDPYWQSQRNLNTFNLNPANLLDSARHAAAYYSASGVVDLGLIGARNTATIETALRAGYEVIWDTGVESLSNTSAIWHVSTGTSIDAHSMLIVGYDRTSADPNNHYFIVKNSWGGTTNPAGMTYVGYDFVARYGINACYLTGINTPGPWTELRALGRRNISLDGHRGTLDIYHIPGASEETWSAAYGLNITDRRLGTFYDSAGNAFRVNGMIFGDVVQFWFKGTAPNMRWDEQRETPTVGRIFSYRLLDNEADDLAGYHWDNAGSTPTPAYGGYAKRPSTITGVDGFEAPVFNNALAWTPAQWLGLWQVRYGSRDIQLVIETRNDWLIPAGDRTVWAGFGCRAFNEATQTWDQVTARIDLAQGREIRFDMNPTIDGASVVAYMQSWQRGVAGGRTTIGLNPFEGALMVRRGEQQVGWGSASGTGCGAVGNIPAHDVTGAPDIGRTLTYSVNRALSYGGAVLTLGLSKTAWNGAPLPLDLGVIGAAGCTMYAEPLVTFFTGANAAGEASWSFVFNQPGMRNNWVYSQVYVLDPAANAAGIRSSNYYQVLLGGSY